MTSCRTVSASRNSCCEGLAGRTAWVLHLHDAGDQAAVEAVQALPAPDVGRGALEHRQAGALRLRGAAARGRRCSHRLHPPPHDLQGVHLEENTQDVFFEHSSLRGCTHIIWRPVQTRKRSCSSRPGNFFDWESAITHAWGKSLTELSAAAPASAPNSSECSEPSRAASTPATYDQPH